MGAPQNDWPGVFAELEGRIVAKTNDSPAAWFSHPFSTSTPTEIAARRVVLLNAASPYYKYASESGSSYVSGWINVFFEAFPLMVRLEELGVSELLDMQEPEEKMAMIEAMTSAPLVKVVTIPPRLSVVQFPF